MARIADVVITNEGFDKEASELVGRAATQRELQVLRKLVNLQGDRVKIMELQAKLSKVGLEGPWGNGTQSESTQDE